MINDDLSLMRYKVLRIKHSQMIKDDKFSPNLFIQDMQPFFADRYRKWQEYTAEKNAIDDKEKPDTKLIKANNKIHTGLFSVIVDQVVGYFLGKQIKWDYDVTEEKKNWIQKTRQFVKNTFTGNVVETPKAPEEFEIFTEHLKAMRFDIKDVDEGISQAATGVGFRLIEPHQLGKQDWELRAQSIEPWFAERYENAAVYMQQRFDSARKQFYFEMTLVTADKITKYSSNFCDLSLYYTLPISINFSAQRDSYKNPLGVIYLAEFKNNSYRLSDFEKVEDMVDSLDTTISNQQDEIEQFRLALMMISGVDLDMDDAQKMLEQLGILNFSDPNGHAEFVTKNVNIEFNKFHMDWIKQQIFTTAKAIDFNDDAFKGNTSGEARKWQLLGLEMKAAEKEKYFTQGLIECATIVIAFMEFDEHKKLDLGKIKLSFDRSLPVDLGYLADALPKLAPFVSTRTLQTQIPFVTDPDYETEMMQMEQNASYGNQDRYGNQSTDEDVTEDDKQ